MKIPLTMLRDLAQFVAVQFNDDAFKPTPEVVGKACGSFAVSWVTERPGVEGYFDESLEAVKSWAERYGKCLGEFYTEERKV